MTNLRDELVTQLRTDVHDLVRPGGLLEILEGLLPEPVVDPTTGTRSRHKVTSSPEPWHVEAGAVLTTIHAGARDIEDALRLLLMGHKTWRGGSDDNTSHALDAIPDLAAQVVDVAEVRTAAREVAAWVRMARQLRDIDQQEKWVTLPRAPQAQPPACPYCGMYSLRWSRTSGDVRCKNPRCRDDEDRPHVARMTTGRYSGQASLVWRDGREITYNSGEVS